jgi:hypothetical protein
MRLTGYVQKIEARRADVNDRRADEMVTIKVYEAKTVMYDSFIVPNSSMLKLNDEVVIEVTAAGKAKAA